MFFSIGKYTNYAYETPQRHLSKHNRVALLAVQRKTLHLMNSASLYLRKYVVLRRLCAECKDGAELYFCAVFALFVFFVGIHIFFAKTKSEFMVQSHSVNYQLSPRPPSQTDNNYSPSDSVPLSFLPLWQSPLSAPSA
jgi:hypothetical protein